MSEKCNNCGVLYEDIYHVPDSLWKKVSGLNDGSGTLCMTCFKDKAKNKGLILWWQASIVDYPTKHLAAVKKIHYQIEVERLLEDILMDYFNEASTAYEEIIRRVLDGLK